jgi:hypothetical protein
MRGTIITLVLVSATLLVALYLLRDPIGWGDYVPGSVSNAPDP